MDRIDGRAGRRIAPGYLRSGRRALCWRLGPCRHGQHARYLRRDHRGKRPSMLALAAF